MPVSDEPGPFLTFTGGTTGAPKAILRDQDSWLFSFGKQGIQTYDRVAVLGGLAHSLALYATIEALHQLADIYLLGGVRPRGQAAAIRDNAITVVYATPTQLKLLAKSLPCPSVRQLYVGGGTFDAAQRSAMERIFPKARITVFYGTSETSFVTVSDEDTPPGSVGRAYPGVTLKADRDDMLWAHSPMLFRDYLFASDTSARRDEGFVCVGDMGRIDPEGNVWLTGRADRVVRISDKSVSLDEVESILAQASSIRHVAAVALPDAKRGHVLGIALCGDPTSLQQHPLTLPKIERVISIDDWPLLPSGKTDYTAIEALFRSAGR